VDGPDTAETGAPVEYVAEENVSNFRIPQMGYTRNPSSNSGSWFLIASTARSLVLASAAANSKRRPEQRTSVLVPFVRPPSGEGEMVIARKFEPRSGCWKLVDTIEVSGTDKDSKDGAVLFVFDTSETKMNFGGVKSEISKDLTYATGRSLFYSTRLSVSHNLPVLFSFFVPPEPPEAADPDGGASGMARLSSAPSIVLIIISKGRGTGFRPSSIIVQLRAIARVWFRVIRKLLVRAAAPFPRIEPENVYGER